MRSLLSAVFLSALWCAPEAHAAGCDRTALNADLQAAQTAGSATERVAILERSLAACPTFQGWYLLGRSRLELQQTEAARQALGEALRIADDDEHRALALGRLAEAYRAAGDAVTALNAADEALRLQPSPPAWLADLHRALDLELEQTVVPAATIAHTLAVNQRTFMPRERSGPRINLRVLFDFDSDRLGAQGAQQVQELGQALAEFVTNGYRVRVIGHTDTQGDARYNQDLSERRALRVALTLAHIYPAIERALTAEGRGETELRYGDWSDEAHRLNRRVEVELFR